MIYSAKVLEIHENICSVEADSEAEARLLFLESDVQHAVPEDDCLGSEYVATVAVVQIKENPNHDADFD